MKSSNPNPVRLAIGLIVALVPGAVMAHSGGPHEAGLLGALAHFLTSWHHLLGGIAAVAAATLFARTLTRARGRAPRPARRRHR